MRYPPEGAWSWCRWIPCWCSAFAAGTFATRDGVLAVLAGSDSFGQFPVTCASNRWAGDSQAGPPRSKTTAKKAPAGRENGR